MEEWPQEWYSKQRQFVLGLKTYWEVIFQAGNGTGKTLMLYSNATLLGLGVHPYYNQVFLSEKERERVATGELTQMPPLRFKVLVTDFEHGLEKIAYETLFQPTYIKSKNKTIGPIMPQSAVKSMWSKEDKTLRLKNGTRYEFMTSEQKRRQHSGTNFDILMCDEEPTEAAYDESVRGLRTGRGGGRVFWAFTPPWEEGKGPSWTKYKKFDEFEEGKLPDVLVINAAMADNPAIDEQYIERFSRGKTHEQLQVQLYGQYPSWGKMIHPDFQDRLWDAKKVDGHLLPYDYEVPFDDQFRFEMGVDWHASKPCAAVWAYEDRDGNIIIYDELAPQVSRDKTIFELAEIFREMEGRPHRQTKFTRWGDPKMKDKSNALIRGFNAWQEFRNCGIRFAEGYNRQPEVGISIVNDFLRGNTKDHPRLFVKEDCVNIRRALRNHYWVQRPDGTGVPDPKWSDYPICVRYIIQGKSRKAKKGMTRGMGKWPLTSYGGDPKFGPYLGIYRRAI